MLEVDRVPERLTVLGGGVIGCEFASIFAHFGSHVTIVEMLPNLIGNEDADAVAALERAFKKRGVALALNARATRVEQQGDGLRLVYADANNEEHAVDADKILVATGRVANVEDLGSRPRRDGRGAGESPSTRRCARTCRTSSRRATSPATGSSPTPRSAKVRSRPRTRSVTRPRSTTARRRAAPIPIRRSPRSD